MNVPVIDPCAGNGFVICVTVLPAGKKRLSIFTFVTLEAVEGDDQRKQWGAARYQFPGHLDFLCSSVHGVSPK